MKLKAALIVVGVMLFGLAAWSQDHPKVEVSIDYSWLRFAAIDYQTRGFQFYRAYDLNGGGGSVVWNFSRMFGIKAEFQGYGSRTEGVIVPPGNPYFPAGGAANVQGNLFTYMFGPQIGKRYGIFRPYVHGLVGGAHTNVYGNAYNFLTLTQVGASPSNNAFAADVGGGLDISVNRRFAIRPFEVSYLYTNFSNKLSNNQNSFRYLGGVVINFGGAVPVPPTASCSATPASVMVGEPVTVTATGSNFNPKHTLTYRWTITGGGKLSSTTTQTATVDTTGMSDGTYTANATITDPKGPKNHNVANCGANFNVNVPHNPPQVTCSANPISVKPGESSTITASATSPDKAQISNYAYTASGGTISSSGTTATLDTTGQPGGTINVTVTATDSRGLTGTCTTSVQVAAPPPPIACVNIEDWGECTFEKDPRRPGRVDNDCKDTLDKLALRLQQSPNGKLNVVGYTDEKEADSKKQVGAQRAVNVKYYMVSDQLGPKVDGSRIIPLEGGSKGKATHFYFVPEGSLCSGQAVEGNPVDESAVQGQARKRAPKKSKSKPAAQ